MSLKGQVGMVEDVLIHLQDQSWVGFIIFYLVDVCLFKLFVSVGLDSGKPADYLELFMELFVPEGSSFGNRRVKDYGLILDLNFQDCLVVNHLRYRHLLSTGTRCLCQIIFLAVSCELKSPCLCQILQSLNKNPSDSLIKIIHPGGKIREIIEIQLINDLLNSC
jgi:hypothetical protein